MKRGAIRLNLEGVLQYPCEPDWAFTRGFLPDWPLSELVGSLTERAFFDFIDLGYEGEMTDLFIEF